MSKRGKAEQQVSCSYICFLFSSVSARPFCVHSGGGGFRCDVPADAAAGGGGRRGAVDGCCCCNGSSGLPCRTPGPRTPGRCGRGTPGVLCVVCGGRRLVRRSCAGGALFTRLNGSIPAFQSDECDPWHMHFPSILYMCHDWAPAGHL